MGIHDVNIIGIGKDAFNGNLDGMIEGRILPWVEDIEEDGYPVWEDYGAVQRSTYFLDRERTTIQDLNSHARSRCITSSCSCCCDKSSAIRSLHVSSSCVCRSARL